MKTTGHSEIAKASVDVLMRFAPEEDYDYFYFGNWLTDMSQVHSPVDFAGALASVRLQVLRAAIEQLRAQTADARNNVPDWAKPALPSDDSAAFQLADQLAERVARLLMGQRPIHLHYKQGLLSHDH